MGNDSDRAREAFDRIAPKVTRFLGGYLRGRLSRDVDRDDVIAVVLQRLWNRRTSLELMGLAAWWGYVAKAGRNCASEHLRRPLEDEISEEFSSDESRAIEGIAVLCEDRERLYRIADETWLGIPPDLSEEDRRTRLLAAQLFYLHGMAWDEVCSLLGTSRPLERQTLDEWLSRREVLLDVAFGRLYLTNDQLAGYLLRPERPLTSAELDEVAKSRAAVGGADANECRLILLRYRYGLLTEKILQMEPGFSREMVEDRLASALPRLPFPRRAQELRDGKIREGILIDAGLWKRLVFQYYAAHELPHRQILERTEPAAAEVGYRLTLGMLNVWLSNGRIFIQLSEHVQREVVHG